MSGGGLRRITACLLLLLALWVPAVAWGQGYRIVDLGVSDPYFPTALNNRGQVLLTNNQLTPARTGPFLASGLNLWPVGTWGLWTGIWPRWTGPASLLWENGHTSVIGLLPDGTFSRGCALNDAGQVAGVGDTVVSNKPSSPADEPVVSLHAFVWQGGGLTDLEAGWKTTQPDGSQYQVFILPSVATGINNQGQVTGWVGTPLNNEEGLYHAFRTAGGLIERETDDLTPGDRAITEGWFINNAGAVLGTKSGGGASSYAFLAGSGGLPPAAGIVYAMNDSGTTVGVAGGHAFVSGMAGGLPQPFEAALGINNQGQIVGQGTMGGRQHALLYSDGQVIDLDSTLPAGSGWELSQAALINDSGQIVVWGSHNGHSALGLLTPFAITLTLAASEISSDDTTSGIVTLSQPAPAGGLAVTLTAEDPLHYNQLAVPDTVEVPEGGTGAQFSIASRPGEIWRYDTLYTLKADAGGAARSTDLMVHPTIHNLYLAVDPVLGTPGGLPVAGTITLSLPAPAGGRAVTIRSSDPAVASIGGTSLVIPAGQQSLDFTIQTGKVTSPTSVEITAQTPTSQETRDFGVHP